MKLQIKRGLPGTGKTTEAFETVRNNGNYARINRDDLRAMLFESKWSGKREQIVIDVEKAIAKVLFDHKHSAIVDDTNLSQSHVDMWKAEAAKIGFTQVIVDDIKKDLSQAILQDALRRKSVGSAVIQRMALFNGLIEWPDKQIVIVDIDGTIADGEHRLHYIAAKPKDWKTYFSKCVDDKPIQFVIDWVKELHKDYTICLVSGRPDTTQNDTISWLFFNYVHYDFLFMRSGGDGRTDVEVKQSILDKLPKDKILFALDDRPRVINEVWRANGVKVYPVRGGIEDF